MAGNPANCLQRRRGRREDEEEQRSSPRRRQVKQAEVPQGLAVSRSTSIMQSALAAADDDPTAVVLGHTCADAGSTSSAGHEDSPTGLWCTRSSQPRGRGRRTIGLARAASHRQYRARSRRGWRRENPVDGLRNALRIAGCERWSAAACQCRTDRRCSVKHRSACRPSPAPCTRCSQLAPWQVRALPMSLRSRSAIAVRALFGSPVLCDEVRLTRSVMVDTRFS